MVVVGDGDGVVGFEVVFVGGGYVVFFGEVWYVVDYVLGVYVVG